MKRAIVNGGAGFVGSALVKELIESGVDVYVIVRPGFLEKGTNKRLVGLPAHIVECDLKEVASLPSKLVTREFDVWYQLAWDGLFGEELKDYKKQLSNVQFVMDAIKAAKEIGCTKFVGSGSISQYELQFPGGRDNPEDKHRVYKTAKLACEYMGTCVAQDIGIEFIWPIFTNIFGAGESSPRLINSMIRRLLKGEHQSLSEGNQYYDFIYISDAARALKLIGEKGKAGRHYVLAGGHAAPLKEFLTTLRDVVAPEAELGFGEMKFNGVYLPAELYSISELAEDTGFVPEISFVEAIQLTAAWISEHEGIIQG